MKNITILIADDHTLLREAWKLILDDHEGFEVIGEANTSEEAVEQAKRLRPQVVIMDINLPGMNGIEATPLIRKYSPITKVLAVSAHTQPAFAKSIMQKGASGYVTKNSPKTEMFEAIRAVAEGRRYICRYVKNLLAEQMLFPTDQGLHLLTPREIDIICLIKEGYSSKEMALRLFISQKTVEVHRYNILRKLKINSTASLINLIHTQHPDFFSESFIKP